MKAYDADRRCCTVCDAKKTCHVCGAQTLYACADCRIDFHASIYVCGKGVCRDAHERKCSARLRAVITEIQRTESTPEAQP